MNLFMWWPESRGALRAAHRLRPGSFLDLWNGQLFHCFSLILPLSLSLVLNFVSPCFLFLLDTSIYTHLRLFDSTIVYSVSHIFYKWYRKNIFKSPLRRESSTFVVKPIGMIFSLLYPSLFLSHSGHFGIDEWRWLTSQFFKRRANLSPPDAQQWSCTAILHRRR